MDAKRRRFLTTAAALGPAVAVGSAMSPLNMEAKPKPGKTIGALTDHKLPPLDYDFGALEPHIDGRTLEIHHDRHHAGYVKGLNNAEKELAMARDINNMPMVDYWTQKLAFHGAGHFLHTLYWKSMSPEGGGPPKGRIASMIDRDFGAFDKFKMHFSKVSKTVEGSGWGLLAMRPGDERLLIFQIENHEKLLPANIIPLMTIDVWEHAYYLKYQNKRGDYISNWWNTVNWAHVNKSLDKYK